MNPLHEPAHTPSENTSQHVVATVTMTTEDRAGGIARITLVVIVTVLVGVISPLGHAVSDTTLLAGALLSALGVQAFLSSWLTDRLVRRATWTLDSRGITTRSSTGRERRMRWNQIERVRVHPMHVRIEGTSRDGRLRIDVGSGLLTHEEWSELRRALFRSLDSRFGTITHEDRPRRNRSPLGRRWSDDPRIRCLTSLGIMTALSIHAATLCLFTDARWPAVVIVGLVIVRIVATILTRAQSRWIDAMDRTPQPPSLAPDGHEPPRRAA